MPKEGKKNMKTIRIDGMDFQGDEGLLLKYSEAVKRADHAEKTLEETKADHQKVLSKLQAERDTANDRADKAEADLKAAEAAAIDPKRLDEAVKRKVALYDAAERAGVEIKDDMADADIRKAVIMAVFPQAKLDGQDETYLEARFDSAVETLEKNADGASHVVAADNPTGESRTDSAAARQRMVELNRRLNRGEKEEG
jgi:hypothetical protein